jgi:hypothetical protein
MLDLYLIRITGTVQKEPIHIYDISLNFLLRMRNVSDQNCRENHNKHFMFNNAFFENRAVYEIMWTNIAQPDWPRMTIWRMRFAS